MTLDTETENSNTGNPSVNVIVIKKKKKKKHICTPSELNSMILSDGAGFASIYASINKFLSMK